MNDAQLAMELKMISGIKIEKIWHDIGDDMIRYGIHLNNGRCASYIEIYGYENDFKEFAQRLMAFPQTIHDKPTFELGKKSEKSAYYILIQAYCYKVDGHSAIKVETTDNTSGPHSHHCRFEIPAEAASINRLGQGLAGWDPWGTKEFSWQAFPGE